MNITSAIVHSAPRCRDSVRQRLQTLPGVEIHIETEDGRFIVTVEDTANTAAADTVTGLHRLEGVLSAAMVYQYGDTEARPGEA